MSKAAFFTALLLGLCAAGLSLLMTHAPVQFGAAAPLLFPGFILGMITSGNVHDFPTWVVALGNFAFYFAAVWLAQILRRRFASSPR